MGQFWQKAVDSLEEILQKSSLKHETMIRRIDKFDYDINLLKMQFSHPNSHFLKQGSFYAKKPRMRKPILSSAKVKNLSTCFDNKTPRMITSSIANANANLGTNALKIPNIVIAGEYSPNYEEVIKSKISIIDKSIHNNTMEFSVAVNDACSHGNEDIENEETKQAKNKEIQLLEERLRQTQTELNWQKTLSDLVLSELAKTREQNKTYKEQAEKIKQSSEDVLHDEIKNWQQIVISLKENCDKELLRKQKETTSLHELLAQWIEKYMELEKSKGINAGSLSSLLSE